MPKFDKHKPLPPEISRNISTDETIQLAKFITLALQNDVPFAIEFDTGRFVPGDRLFRDDGKFKADSELTDDDVVQGDQGFKMEVGGAYLTDEEKNQRLYRTIGEAVQAGLQMLFGDLQEQYGKPEAIRIFSEFFKVIDDKA